MSYRMSDDAPVYALIILAGITIVVVVAIVSVIYGVLHGVLPLVGLG